MAHPPPGAGGVTLDHLLRALNTAFVELLGAPAGIEASIESVMLLDSDDLSDEEFTLGGAADLCLLAGVGENDAVAWLGQVSGMRDELRPRAVMSKAAGSSTVMQVAARDAGVALIAVHAQTRWESLLVTIRGLLDHSLGRRESSLRGGSLFGADTDLFALAHTVATLTQGMVSIEDDRSRVLAYSASDDAADELRKLSILGREGPTDYLKQLREWGVFDRLRRTDEVIEVPAVESLAMRRRLVVSIREVPEPTVVPQPRRSTPPRTLGAIWLQEGQRRLAADSEAVLVGASAVAARLITRWINAPTNEAVQIQRLLGARGGGVDVVSLAAALSIPTSGPAVVIGFGALDSSLSSEVGELSSALRLHAGAFARESLVTTIGDRIYVLMPRTPSFSAVASWTGGVIERVTARGGTPLRAAIAAPVSSLADVAAARFEVDRVLDGTTGDRRVTTLADSRTPILLGEIVDLIAAHPELTDPRIVSLVDYDLKYSSSMQESTEAYLRHFGDVRRAAEHLRIHPNTLRYRVKRVEEILDIDLTDPTGRLLVEIQLAVLGRKAR
jgi:hypothetical protein